MSEAPRQARLPTARVFFALWPDAQVRQALMRAALSLHRRVDGKLTREESVHMTLLFLGATPTERLGALAELGASAPFEAFALDLDAADCWKHNKIAWVAPSTTPPALASLVQHLGRGAVALGFPVDSRPFAPHLTLVRKARCSPLDLEPLRIRWDVRDFVLVRSELGRDGSRYHTIGRWPPGPQAPTSVSAPQPSPSV
jgi:2'-5' RNA ligase